MSLSHILQIGLPVVFGVLAAFVAFKVGRRWRREYRGAKALRASLESTVATQAEALSALRAEVSAVASGNTVILGDTAAARFVADHSESIARGTAVAGAAGPVLPRADSGPDFRAVLGVDVGVSDHVGQLAGADTEPELDRVLDAAHRGKHARRVLSDDG